MKTVSHNGKTYRVSYSGRVEVYIPMGEPRVMRDPKSAYWRSLKIDSSISNEVRKIAGVSI